MTATTGEAINSNPCETVDSRLLAVLDGIRDGAQPHPSDLPPHPKPRDGMLCISCGSYAPTLMPWLQLTKHCKHCAAPAQQRLLVQPCNRLFRPQKNPDEDVYYFAGYLIGFKTAILN